MITLKTDSGITIQFECVTSLIDLMTGEQKIQLIESLSCYDEVVKHVSDQIFSVYGSTENGYSGSHVCSAASYSGSGSELDIARFKSALLDESSRDLINAQANSINSLLKEKNDLLNEISKMQNLARGSNW